MTAVKGDHVLKVVLMCQVGLSRSDSSGGQRDWVALEGQSLARPPFGRPLRALGARSVEPATPRFTILCSNQLSYDRRKRGPRSQGGSDVSSWLESLGFQRRPTGLGGPEGPVAGATALRAASPRAWGALRRTRDPKIHNLVL